MGTKSKVKTRPNKTEETEKKEKKTKRIFLFRMVRKRKRLSQSQEFLHETQAENFKIDLEVDDQEKEHDVVMDAPSSCAHPDYKVDDIVNDSGSKDEHDHTDDAEVTDEKRKTPDEKKGLFSSPIKFLKNSFSTKKRRKQTEYSKFSDSTENILPDLHQTKLKPEGDCVEAASNNVKRTKQTNSKRYVRFETDDDDDDKENMEMTIDEDDYVINNHPQSSSSSTLMKKKKKKKKKSAKKRVAKASRNTGRVLREGMIQIGRNLQYLTPMPTPHVFAEPSKKKADYTDKPKKQNYKYTASAPPSNPYGFI